MALMEAKLRQLEQSSALSPVPLSIPNSSFLPTHPSLPPKPPSSSNTTLPRRHANASRAPTARATQKKLTSSVPVPANPITHPCRSPPAPLLVPPLNLTVGASSGSARKGGSAALKGVKLVKKRPREKAEHADDIQPGEHAMEIEEKLEEQVNLQ